MTSTPLSMPPRMLLEIASKINADDLLPLHVPVLTIRFLHHLGRHCDHSSKPLGRFLLCTSNSRIISELLRITLPVELQDLRTEYARLQDSMEKALAAQDWPRARALRDQKHLLKEQLRLDSNPKRIEVEPEHVRQALANLGFREALHVNR